MVSSYDSMLRVPETAAALRPTAVLQIGNLPTSKVLRGWLGSIGASHFARSEL